MTPPSLRAAAIALLLELVVLVSAGRALAATGAPAASSTPAVEPTKPAPASAARATAPPLPPEYIVQESDWIRLAYHPSMRERVRTLAAEADAFRAELRRELGASVLASIEVRIAAGVPGEADRLAPGKPASAEAAATFPALRLIVLIPPSPLALEPASLADTLRHELARLALDQALEGAPSDAAAPPSDAHAPHAPRAPRWFLEGYAVHMAGAHAALRAQTLCLASLQGKLLSLDDIARGATESAPPASIAYAQAADFIRFLRQPSSQGRFTALVEAARDGAPFDRAVSAAYSQSLVEIELAWRKDMARRYSFMPVFLASTIVWVFAGAIIAARRARRARERRPLLVRDARHARRVELEPRARPVAVPTSRAAAASRVRDVKTEIEALGEPLPPDAEVPKVEHEGQWHTLH